MEVPANTDPVIASLVLFAKAELIANGVAITDVMFVHLLILGNILFIFLLILICFSLNSLFISSNSFSFSIQ